MSLLNSIYLKFYSNFIKEIDITRNNPYAYQEYWFKELIRRGANTAFGKEHNFDSIKNIDDFRRNVPILDYNATAPYINRLRNGEDYVLWDQKVRWYAKSSGTSADKSKYIPITPDSLQINHFGGFKRMIASYLHNNPKSNLYGGKALTLGGSVKPDISSNGNIFSGDLSAVLLKNSPSVVEFFRTPSRKAA
ncbi:MAG: GH3 auxin-responsive promoter family protein, partial [Bacteroidales bacterium]|nr:GH3 auxin-responsive promoter family protein [Bacteroidales bacterium]